MYAEHKACGTIYLRSTAVLGPYPVKLTERLDHWASAAPARIFLGQRKDGASWRTITYGQFRRAVRNVAQALLNRGISSATPVAILSGNDIEHAILGMAAMYAGIPYAPISPNYSLLSADFQKLAAIVGLLKPQFVFASGAEFAPAIQAVIPKNVEVVNTESAFASLLATGAGADVDAAHELVSADTVAKILFTSGSMGAAKAVVNTQRMIASNQEMILTALPVLQTIPPILCDWLPWHHTFGGNHNFGLTLYNGGTLYIDAGRPTTEGMDQSVRNLQDAAPTVYFNVPRGFEALLTCLKRDSRFARKFFSHMQVLFCAAADLGQKSRDELSRLARAACGRTVPLITGFGATETAPLSIFSGPDMSRESLIGLPVPGMELKLVPTSAKLELYVRGPNVTPGYLDNEGNVKPALDAAGFYATGDAVRFVDSADPSSGLKFDGRIGEDFKLSSGTWVDVETLRGEVMLRCQPLICAVVIAGENRDYAIALLFPHLEAMDDPELQEIVPRLLRTSNGSSSRRVGRAVIVREPLCPRAGELTGKGTVNQRQVLINRASMIDDLYNAFAVTLPPSGQRR